jgi:hypothetical protein
MGRVLGCFVLTLALLGIASAQASNGTTNGPTAASTMQPAVLGVPAPPNVALPGSGTPTGTPPNLDVNNSLTNSGGSIYQPGVSGYVVGGQPVSGEQYLVSTPTSTPQNPLATNNSSATTSSTAPSGTAPSVPNFSASRYIGSMNSADLKVTAQSSPKAAAPGKSLAEIAEQFHPRQPGQKHVYVNGDIYALSNKLTPMGGAQNSAMPQSDQQASEQGSANSSRVQTKPEDVLDPNDLAAVERALARSTQNQNGGQTTEAANQQNPPSNPATNELAENSAPQQPTGQADQSQAKPQSDQAADQNADQTAQQPQKQQLPASGSELPLMAILGVGALCAGLFAARKFSRSR